jgi:nucleoid DNA-binding protein
LSRPNLIKQLKQKNPKLNRSTLEAIVDVFFESISASLKLRKDVQIREMGTWYCKVLKENFNARNPATNELIYKPERVKIRFRPSKKIKKIINE